MPWYRKKSSIEGRVVCPVCDGTGSILDVKTDELRDCVLCIGEGSLPEKSNDKVAPNARVVPMSQAQLESIINTTKLTSK